MRRQPANGVHRFADRGQAAVVQFLYAQSDIAFTILKTAELELASGGGAGQARYRETIASIIRQSLEALREFEASVGDARERARIHTGADQLNASLASFEKRR